MSFYITRALLLRLSAVPLALSGSLGMPVPALAEAARGHAAPDAESFVQLQANRILGSLSGPHLSSDQKTQQFRAVIAQVADVPRVTEFVLGKYRRTTSPEQQARFAVAFRQFAYWERFDQAIVRAGI